jgi:hypothetical protein
MVAEIEPRQRKRLVRPDRIPECTRLTIRSLYVVHAKSPSEIALAVQLSASQVSSLCQREGWTRERDKKLNRKESKAIATLDAHANESIDRVNETVGIMSEELTVRSLSLCGEYLDSKDPKSLQMASSAARNLDQVRRGARNLDRGSAAEQQSGPTMNFFLVRAGNSLVKEERSANPAPIEIEAAPAQQ